MRHSLISRHELAFFQTNSANARPYEVMATQLKYDTSTLKYIYCRPLDVDESKYCYAYKHPKHQIVLHFTAGYLRGDISTLTGDRGRVSVPFLISRGGQILNLFHSGYWSYHLGPNAVGGNKYMSQRTIAIELSNIGPLIPKGNNLHTTYSKPERPDIYCTLDDTDQYYYVEEGYRGYKYFASFPQEQMTALVKVLKYLGHTYDIPLSILGLDARYRKFSKEEAHNYHGIVSHVNYRGAKWDIGPAFDWEWLEKELL